MTSRHPSHRSYHRIFSSVFVLVAAICTASSAKAEDSFLTESARPTVNNLPRLYLTLASGVAPDIGLAGMAALTVGGEHLQVTGRLGVAKSVTVFGPPKTSVGELGLMVGYGQNLGLAHFYAAAGMGMLGVERLGRQRPDTLEGGSKIEYEMVKQTTFNIPIQVGVDLGRRVASGGLALVANLNSSASYVGFLVTVNLGKLR